MKRGYLDRPGLTPEERDAYAANYWVRWQTTEEARRDREEERLRKALAHAGAELKDFLERRDVYTVTYEVDGARHVSTVAKGDLAVPITKGDGQLETTFDMRLLQG